MGGKFNATSIRRLATCEAQLQLIAQEAIKIVPFQISWGHRTLDEQAQAIASGNSRAKPGESKHNYYPSLAFDFIPDPLNSWDRIHDFTFVAGHILAVGFRLGIRLRYGGDFDGDGNLKGGWDWGHIELIE